MDINRVLRRKIVVLDGAMGTALIAKGYKGSLELLNVEAADVVGSLHEEYLKAGADMVTTNTTCADALSLKEYGLEERSYELSRAGAEVARKAVDKYSTTENPRFVAGAVGPTTRNITLANDTTEEQLAEVYATQIKGLIDGGVDLILIETAMDAANVRIAVEQVRKLSPEMPIIVSAVLSRLEGRVASGATIAKFVEELPMEEILAVGFNCSMGDKQQAAALKALSAVSNKPVVLYPALSQPQEAPNRFLKPLDTLMRAGGVNIIGGCCGTTPAHIEALAKAAARWRPRKIE
ncbi:MAG: homocysteine S-methyltransferase family protein [Alistipes sp.]|nr:homocysteine S-methyltransferase family protein [Alistipes sp.]